MSRRSIRLASPANEMVREEILKQAAHVSRSITALAFETDNQTMSFEVPDAEATELEARIGEVAAKIQRSLRSLERRLVHRSEPPPGMPGLPGGQLPPGARLLGTGQAALQGQALALFRFFDRVFREFGEQWNPIHLQTPTLIPATALAKCDYFRSFPQYVTFAAHIEEDFQHINDFRQRHQKRDTLDELALKDMATPDACLSPAVCYHVYHMHANTDLPAPGQIYSIAGKCFRFESTNLQDLRRLWDFTMRELVFIGPREWVLEQRQVAIARFLPLLAELGVGLEIRTASDPFFVAPDAAAKSYFQLSSETKYEMAMEVAPGDFMAVGSFNYHTDFFGKAFTVRDSDGGPMHSVCVAFGLERWVHGFVAQYGTAVRTWPEFVRRAPEIIAAGA
jgi:seryl-tRNA synthetase